MISTILILLGTLCLHAAAAEKNTTPNVVMIVSDDQGWTDFGFMGHKVIQTPRLDQLASQSAVFVNGYVPTSLCRASLATLLTGLYGHEHKICCNDPPEGVDRQAMLPFMREAPTIPRVLKEAGYISLQTGKFWEGHYSNAGFTHGMTENKAGGRHGDAGLTIGRQTMQPIYDFIEQRGHKPFFVWYAPMMPHLPHDPPESLFKKYALEGRDIELAKYWAMCEWFDQTCGELLEYLDKKGLRDNTLVIFVVDNGWVQETRPGQATLNGASIRSKLSPYDAGLRTPIMLRWPGHIAAGRHDDLVSTVDIAPTILSACGVKPTPRMSGINLIDLVEGKRPGRKAVFGEIFLHSAINVEKPALNLTHRWVRESDWKLIVFEDKKTATELYDLAHDPAEEKNLAADHPDKVGHLTQILDAWWNGR